MSTEVNRKIPVFDKLLNFQIVQTNSFDVDNKTLTLRILSGKRINNGSSVKISPSSATGIHNHGINDEPVIHFEVTDENDPYFLYFLDLSSSDFQTFKKENNILVEFTAFANEIIELLNRLDIKDSTCGMTISLNTSSGVISLIEKNGFKLTTIISMKFVLGNDTSIKGYLASRLIVANDTLSKQIANLNELNQRLVDEQLKTKEQAIHLATIQSNHNHELSSMKVKCMQDIEEIRSRYESQFQITNITHESIRNELQSKLHNLEDQQRALINLNKQLELKVSESCTELQLVTEQKENFRNSLDITMKEKSSLMEQSKTLDRQVIHLESKIQGLEKQLFDKDLILNNSNDNRDLVQQQLHMYMEMANEYKEKYQVTTLELKNKSNIVASWGSELSQLKASLNTKNKVIRKQEEKVNELAANVVDLNSEVLRLKSDLLSMKQNLETQTRQVEESRALIEKKDNEIISLNQCIEYLNTELSTIQARELSYNAYAVKNMSNYSSSNANTTNSFQDSSPNLFVRPLLPKPTLYKHDPTIIQTKDIYAKGIEVLGLSGTLDLKDITDSGDELSLHYLEDTGISKNGINIVSPPTKRTFVN